jgi:HNH endonuclease
VRIAGAALYVHRLVLLAFVGPPGDGQECCHANGDRADCRLENLRWDTRHANRADARRHGTLRGGGLRGEASPQAKLSEGQVQRIRAAAGKQRDIAAAFGVSQKAVWLIKARKTWGHVA